MLGLIIRDEVRWHDRWSTEIGKTLTIKDSSDNLYIFDEQHKREDVLAILQDAPQELYQLLEVENAPEEECDYLADSGQCYRRIH